MHTVQILLVEAESVEDARDRVVAAFDSETPAWSDWNHVIPGETTYAGRWQGEFFGADNKHDVLCYNDDPTLAATVIFEMLSSRDAEIELLRKQLREADLDIDLLTLDYDAYSKDDKFQLWRVKHLAEILSDAWTSSSKVYDLQAYSANLSDFQNRIQEDPSKQYLVAVDFHL